AGRFLSDELEPAVTPPTVWAEGGLWSCVEDLARWLSFQLREDGGLRKDAQVLAGPTLKEMHAARYLGNDEWTEAWGIAWYSVRRQGFGDRLPARVAGRKARLRRRGPTDVATDHRADG